MRCKTFFFCLAVISWFNLGACLKCYYCAGSLTSDCAKGKTSSMVVEDCFEPLLPTFLFGLRSTPSGLNETVDRAACISVTNIEFPKKMFMRLCTRSSSDNDPCKYWIRDGNYENCKSCTTDKCNSHKEDEISVHLIP